MDEIIWLKSHLINWNAMCVEDPYRIQSCSRNLRFSCFVEHVTSVGNTPIGTSTLKQKFKKCLLNYFEIMRYFNCFAKKDLSDSSAGCIFFRQHYNEGLKFGDFRFSMYRYKCFRPNKTYFLNFCQKLSILKLIYEKKQICYFHVGYAMKLY